MITDITDLAAYCYNVMGNFPRGFALVGMGSLARKEVTPYSDFENTTVLENKECKHLTEAEQEAILEYFRWFAVIFQTVLVNLKESILPSLVIPCSNDFYSGNQHNNLFYDAVTTRGVSIDGMMPQACKSPLGTWQQQQQLNLFSQHHN